MVLCVVLGVVPILAMEKSGFSPFRKVQLLSKGSSQNSSGNSSIWGSARCGCAQIPPKTYYIWWDRSPAVSFSSNSVTWMNSHVWESLFRGHRCRNQSLNPGSEVRKQTRIKYGLCFDSNMLSSCAILTESPAHWSTVAINKPLLKQKLHLKHKLPVDFV